jgi:ribosome-binding factor A
MDAHRIERVAEALRTELEEIINYELADPRVGTAAITEILVSPDRKKAHVRLALEGDAGEQEAALEAIQNAKGYLRHVLSERMEIYRIPDLSFSTDVSAGIREKAGKLLKRMNKGRPRDAGGE